MRHTHIAEVNEMPALVEVEGIRVTYVRRRWLAGRAPLAGPPALDGVDLRLEAGCHTALVGQSGGGKSTLARVMCGLQRPSAGRVTWSGEDITHMSRRVRRARARQHVQYVWQDPYASLDPRCTVHETLRESVLCHGPDRADESGRVDALLASVELTGVVDSRIAVLSGGERRRLTVARALAARPAVLVADEPTTGLDPVLALEMARLLRRVCHAPGGPTLLLITHDVDVARHTCGRAVVIARGTLAFEGPVCDLSTHEAPVVRRLLDAASATRLGAGFGRERQAGVAALEYIVIMAAATLTLGILFYMLSQPIRDYLDFALWWLSSPFN